jgi:hypothetical protein
VTDNLSDGQIMRRFRASMATDASSAAVDLLKGAFGEDGAQQMKMLTWAPGFARRVRDDVTALWVHAKLY